MRGGGKTGRRPLPAEPPIPSMGPLLLMGIRAPSAAGRKELQNPMSVRIGIDVGGTFTDAVVVDNDTFELIGTVKVPTTHHAPGGVAAGIVQALQEVLRVHSIPTDEVSFIAHGTTQATNALLEGDVERVGVIGVGKGVEGYKVKLDTDVGDIELAPSKFLRTKHYFVTQDNHQAEAVAECMDDMRREDIHVAVVSAAYSVDDPSEENAVMEQLVAGGISGTCSHEISKLYGLRIRSRTAVINASILPKMIQTADMTEQSVLASHIKAPLMVMRCDGGVMSVKEIRKRPILTMLSGPAAGVAGALMYEKVSEGIFLEVGGTSTDISAIRNGQVMVNYAEVGGHKTYVSSLDVRTVGVAGGSMIRVSGRTVVDVGPRSAHIANLPYIVYTPPEALGELEIRLICPKEGDFDDYCAVYDRTHDQLYALTLACAANLSGYVKPEHYAKGYVESAAKAFDALADFMHIPVADILRQIHHKAAEKNKPVVKKLIEDHELIPEQVVLVGGGGGAAAVVPYLAEELGVPFRIAKNAEVISPIGVALAMVRDIVERTIANPTDEDILMVRREAEQQAIKSGASPGTVEVFIEVDGKNNVVRAIATGATELRTKNRMHQQLAETELLEIARATFPEEERGGVSIAARNEDFLVVQSAVEKKKLFGLITRRRTPTRILNREGVVRIQSGNAVVVTSTVADCEREAELYIGRTTQYTEGGEKLPQVYMMVGPRLIDLSRLMNQEQILTLMRLELVGVDPNEPVILVLSSSVSG